MGIDFIDLDKDFDSAIPRFESWHPSQRLRAFFEDSSASSCARIERRSYARTSSFVLLKAVHYQRMHSLSAEGSWR
jgi:hypothetical protein